MNRKDKVFLIAVLSLFFLSGMVFAEYSNDVPTPTVIIPPKTSTPPPPPAPKESEQPRIKVTAPHISDDYETTTPTLTGANVIVRVLESGVKKAISGATVKWYSAKYATGGVTDGRGEAKIGQVMPGDAKITASARGYETNSKTVRAQNSAKVQYFDIYLNKITKIAPSPEMPGSVVVTPTEKKATISGTVYDKTTSKPISGAAVKAYNTGYKQDLVKDVKTDRSGRYAIDNCPLDTAIKIIYSKADYTPQEILRYIPKAATVYTQDVYLEKATGEKRRDVETLKRSEGREYINCAIVEAKLGEAEILGDIIELPYGWWPLHIKYTNYGPDTARDVRPVYRIINLRNFTEETETLDRIDFLRKDEYKDCYEMLYFEPGFYSIFLEVCDWWYLGYGYEDDERRHIETNSSDNYREAVLWFHDDNDTGADVNIELIRFEIDHQPISDNPTLDIGDGEHTIYIQFVNYGPQLATGPTHVVVEKSVSEGASETIYSEDLSPAGINEIQAIGLPHPFTPGRYFLNCRVTRYDKDFDISYNEENATVRSNGYVTFTGELPITREMIENLQSLSERMRERTLTPIEEPAESEPAEDDAGAEPAESDRESTKTDIKLVSFNVEGQPVTNNPVIQIAENQPVTLSFAAINNGPDEANGPCSINLSGIGLGGSQPIDLRRRLNVMVGNSTQRNFAHGSYNFTATIEPAAGDEDPDRSNNTISGMVAFVPVVDAAAEPGGEPDDGQPDDGQPDDGRPDDGQPGGGGQQPPGGWQPGGGGQPPGGEQPGGRQRPPRPPQLPQADLDITGGGFAPTMPPAPPVMMEEVSPQAMAGIPVEHPQMGRGPADLPVAASAPSEEEEVVSEMPTAEEPKKGTLPLLYILLALGIASGAFVIFVIAKRKRKKTKNEV